MLMDLLKWTFLTLRRILALGKGQVEVSRRLQAQSPALTHLEMVDFLALGRIGMLARQVPCPRVFSGGREEASVCGCRSWHLRLPLCSTLLGVHACVFMRSWHTSSFWYWWNGPQNLLPALSPIKASCGGYCVATGWREGWQQIACLIYCV